MAFFGSGEYDGTVPSDGLARHMRQNPQLAARWQGTWTDDDLRAHAKRAIARHRLRPVYWIRRAKETITRWLAR